MKFIHCSDLHIDSPLLGLERYPGTPVDEMRDSTRQAFHNIVSAAIENKVDLVVISGDVFDGNWRDFNTGLFFTDELARLREAKIKVVLLKGNHDAESEVTKSLRWPSNVKVLAHRAPETVIFEDIGVAVHGQSFAEKAVTTDLAAQYSTAKKNLFNLGMLHTCMAGGSTHLPYAPTTLQTLGSKGYDYWALGHVHEREILCQEPRVVFSGNSQGRHARELGAKGCDLVTVDDDGIRNDFLEVDAVRWAQVAVDIGGILDLDALMEKARGGIVASAADAGGRVVAIRLVLTGSGKVHSELVADPEKAIAQLRAMTIDETDGRGWVERVKLQTGPHYDRTALAVRDDPVGELVRFSTKLESSDAELQQMARETLGSMLDKLPSEVRNELKLNDREQLKAVLREAESQVLSLLGSKT
ncbi:MAG: DNA repair exonuclease [Betaproteobacteria bacterium]|nr:MAG: DNA repair exonuclease [Betaproteobacteria bacterium]